MSDAVSGETAAVTGLESAGSGVPPDVAAGGNDPGREAGCESALVDLKPESRGDVGVIAAGDNAAQLTEQDLVVAEDGREAAWARAYLPFPVDCLPTGVREFVTQFALAMDCDEAFLALPALAVLAGAIGNSRRIRILDTWSEPAIVWTAVVGDSGARKSPPLQAATQFRWETMNCAIHFRSHWMTSEQWDQQVKKNDPNQCDDIPDLPLIRNVVSEVAAMPLIEMLNEQPRGLLVCRDELDGWLSRLDTLRGKGNDLACWLEFHGGRPMQVDRGHQNRRSYFVPSACVSLTGGIQPDVLAARFTKSHLSSGLFARLLFAFPPPRPRHCRALRVDAKVGERYKKIVRNLSQLSIGKNWPALVAPQQVTLTPDARKRFIRFVNEFGIHQKTADSRLAASFSKLEGYAARFALILHLTRSVDEDWVDPNKCDLQSIERGIELSEWFAGEARRVRALVCENSDETAQRKLVEWLYRHDGQATARDLLRSWRKRCQTIDEAAAALNALAKSGVGKWVERPASVIGGRPHRVFVLAEFGSAEGGSVDLEVPNSGENEGSNS